MKRARKKKIIIIYQPIKTSYVQKKGYSFAIFLAFFKPQLYRCGLYIRNTFFSPKFSPKSRCGLYADAGYTPLSTVYVTSLATSVLTMCFLIEIMFILKAIKSHLKGSFDKQNLTLVVISYEVYETPRRLIS